MAYTKQTFTTGQTLKASDLNTMSQGIKDLDDGKQAKLVSGTSLRTINGYSLLGEGNIEIKLEDDKSDTLLGSLPYTIDESNCYMISKTNATISTGEGGGNNLYQREHEYCSKPDNVSNVTWTSNSLTFDTDGTAVTFGTRLKGLEAGKTYTLFADLSEKTVFRICTTTKDSSYVGTVLIQHSGTPKSFTVPEGVFLNMTFGTASGATAGTFSFQNIIILEGEHTALPQGVTFEIDANVKYSLDGYIGSTLSAVNGELVEVYRKYTDKDNATDMGGVIFFGDSIMDFSDIPNQYSIRTGKSVLDCSIGGTRMSDSRDEGNEWKPYDMASIAHAFETDDFTAQIDGGKNKNIFTAFATGNVSAYKCIILEFGTNDFSAEVPFRGESTDTVEGALKYILRTLITKYPNIRIVVLSTLQYVTLGNGNESGVPTHDDGSVWEMNQVIKDVCESDEFCVPFVDMYHRFGQNAITRNVLNSDGVHLTSPNGVKRYLDILVGQLNALGI